MANQNETRKVGRSNLRSIRRNGILLVLSLMMMLQYQNCTPSETEEMADGAAAPGSVENGRVTVIDDVKANAGVSFAQKEVAFHSDVNQASVTGQCSLEQDGARLGWKLLDSKTGQELDTGFTYCQQGQFEVSVAPMANFECDHDYKVTARLGFGSQGEITITRRCAPEAALDAPAMKASLGVPDEDACAVEKRQSESGEMSCKAVCYDSAGVVKAERVLDAASCE